MLLRKLVVVGLVGFVSFASSAFAEDVVAPGVEPVERKSNVRLQLRSAAAHRYPRLFSSSCTLPISSSE